MSKRAPWVDAETAFDTFYEEWFMVPGGTREEGVALARAAADAIEQVWTLDLSDEEIEQAEHWLEGLLHVPEIEKDWFGLAEYRLAHKVKP